MPIDYSEYPDTWETEIRPAVLERAGNCCEGSPAYPDCRVPNHQRHPVTGSKVVLTIAHLDHDKRNPDPDLERLRAWCQRCHLKYDLPRHMANRRRNRLERIGQPELDLDMFLDQQPPESTRESVTAWRDYYLGPGQYEADHD